VKLPDSVRNLAIDVQASLVKYAVIPFLFKSRISPNFLNTVKKFD